MTKKSQIIENSAEKDHKRSAQDEGDLTLCKLFLAGIFLDCSLISTLMEILQLTYSRPSLSSLLEMLLTSNSRLHQFKITVSCSQWTNLHRSVGLCYDFLNVFVYHNLHPDLTSVEKTSPTQSNTPHRSCKSLSPCKSMSAFREKHPQLRIQFCCFINSVKNSLLFFPGDLTNQLMFKCLLYNDWDFLLGTM